MKNQPRHRFEIRPLTPEEGGGYLISFPELPGCLADGETIEEAVKNGAEAEASWLAAETLWEKPSPKKLVARLPLSLHHDLTIKARQEGISLNTLIVSLLNRGLERRL
jgi:antitoxin HicB